MYLVSAQWSSQVLSGFSHMQHLLLQRSVPMREEGTEGVEGGRRGIEGEGEGTEGREGQRKWEGEGERGGWEGEGEGGGIDGGKKQSFSTGYSPHSSHHTTPHHTTLHHTTPHHTTPKPLPIHSPFPPIPSPLPSSFLSHEPCQCVSEGSLSLVPH